MAEWVRLWAKIHVGVAPPLSDWEVVGLNPTASMSRIGVFMQGRNVSGFP